MSWLTSPKPDSSVWACGLDLSSVSRLTTLLSISFIPLLKISLCTSCCLSSVLASVFSLFASRENSLSLPHVLFYLLSPHWSIHLPQSPQLASWRLSQWTSLPSTVSAWTQRRRRLAILSVCCCTPHFDCCLICSSVLAVQKEKRKNQRICRHRWTFRSNAKQTRQLKITAHWVWKNFQKTKKLNEKTKSSQEKRRRWRWIPSKGQAQQPRSKQWLFWGRRIREICLIVFRIGL